MKFNKEIFFKEYNKEFGDLNQYQVDGLNRLLDLYQEYYGWWDNISEISNSLAQIKLETNSSFNPVVEGYYLGDKSKGLKSYFQGDSQRVKNFQKKLRYYPYFGIGDIQLTWKDNYEKHDRLIRDYFPEIVEDFHNRTGTLLDLGEYPYQALDGKISFAIMTIGMQRGTFRGGRKLSDYLQPDGSFDHKNARGIVNGDMRHKVTGTNYTIGEKIERDGLKFERILKKSLVSGKKEEDILEIDNQPEIITSPIPKEINEITPTTEVTNSVNSKDVVIEKTKPKNFLSVIRTEISALMGGNVSIQMAKEWAGEAQLLPFSSNFWTYLTIILAVGSLIYLLIRYLKYREETKRDLEITSQLINANSTTTNKVLLVDTDEINKFKDKGYTVINR